MNLIDRLLIRGYLKAYLVCLTSLLCLYIVVDLFTNLEDFTDRHGSLTPVLRHIGQYYGYRVAKIFDQLCEAIVLLAAMFTVAWMQRSNELLPLLSAGVSTRRVVRPVLFSACALLSLAVINQEIVIPRIGSHLVTDRDDPSGEKDIVVHSAHEPNGINIEGQVASRREMLVKEFDCLIPESVAGNLLHLHAREARYLPPIAGRPGGWLLTGTHPPELPEGWSSSVLEQLDPGKYFLRTKEVDFATVTRRRTWYLLSSTTRLWEELSDPNSTHLTAMAVLFHMRLTRPILGLLLVVLGLSVILRDQNRNIFISTALCLVLCAVFFGASFACKHLGDNEYLSPALAAWLPVLCFGPLAFTLFDAVHT